MKRLLSVGLAACAFSAFSYADFDGPAPLAWRWVQPTTNSPVGSPTVQDGIVYAAVGSRMYALDKESGNQRWKFPLVEAINGSFKSTVILNEGLAIAAGNNKTVYGVDAKTGEPKWTYISLTPIYKEPVLAGKLIVFALSDNTMMAINASDGQPAWKQPVKVYDGFLGKLAAYQSNVYYFTNNYEMVSYSVTTQKENWKQKFSVISPDVQAINLGDNLFMNTGTYVVGISAVTGRKIFEANTGESLDFAPAANGESVLGVSQDGKVFLFGSNGRPLVRKEIHLGSQPASAPSVVGKFYAVPTRNGAINLIDSKTGDIVWSYLVRPIGEVMAAPAAPSGGGRGGGLGGGGAAQAQPTRVLAVPAAGPPVLDGNTLFVLAIDGSVLAFDKNLGVDLTSPSVKMLWPSAGDLVSGQPPLELIFKIEDEASGINTKTLKIMIGDQEMEHEFGRDGIAMVRISALGKNKPLMDGRKVITVIVSDWLGNQTKSEFALVVDNTLRPLSRPTSSPGGPGGPGGGGAGGFGGGGGLGGGGGDRD